MIIRFAGVLALLLVATHGAAGQGVVGGRVIERDSQRAIGCVSVTLRDQSMRTVARTDTRRDGTFEFAAPSTGTYHLVLAAFGVRPVEVALGVLNATTDREQVFEMQLVPHDSLVALWRDARADTIPRSVAEAPRVPIRVHGGQSVPGRPPDVIIGYTVDERGRSDPATAFSLEASSPEASARAVSLLSTLRFRAARVNGKTVCRFVAAPVSFSSSK